MTAPLFDVKNKLSEYVSLAQNGEVIEVQKHGKPAVVILDAAEYYRSKPSESDFSRLYNSWHDEMKKICAHEKDNLEPFWNAIENGRKNSISRRPAPFAEE